MSSATSRSAQLSARSRVFLDEMGIAPLWGLRCGEPGDGAAPVDSVIAAGEQHRAAVAPDVQPSAAAAMALEQADQSDDAVRPAQAALSGSVADTSTNAWFDDAPAAQPAVSAEAIAAMDWQQMRAAAAKCTRCDLCRNRKTPVFGRGAMQASWLVLAGAPSRADEKNAQAISGDAGRLLANMLMAAGVAGKPGEAAADKAYVTNLVKCRAVDSTGQDRAPSADEAAACRPFLERELTLTGAGTVLAFGQATLKELLGDGAPARRGVVHRLGALAVVASYHPEDLLRQKASKAAAWADLCLARDAHAGRE